MCPPSLQPPASGPPFPAPSTKATRKNHQEEAQKGQGGTFRAELGLGSRVPEDSLRAEKGWVCRDYEEHHQGKVWEHCQGAAMGRELGPACHNPRQPQNIRT